jgi:hypothetical protein
MNFYDTAFLALISGCGFLTWQQYHTRAESPEEKSLAQAPVTPRAKAEASQFTRLFLTVYCLVMASDWLQGESTLYNQHFFYRYNHFNSFDN